MPKSFLRFIWETSEIVIIAFLIVAPIRYFVFQPFFVRGQSMEPNFRNGDYLIVDELTYRLHAPQRGDVVVFKYPLDISQKYIKRIIGLPGETVVVKDGKVFVSSLGNERQLQEQAYLPTYLLTPGEVKVSLGPNQYFVLGDNRPASSDSRRWGILPAKDLIGRVLIRAWPPGALAYLGHTISY